MPQAIGFALAWLASNTAAILGASVAAQATIAAAAASLGTIALGIGAALVYSAITAQAPVKPSDGQTETKDPLSPRRTSYGIVRTAGAVWFRASIGTYYYVGQALNHGRIGSVISRHIDENVVEVDGSELITSSPYVEQAGTQAFYVKLGTNPETEYSRLATDFALSEMRGDGVATMLGVVRNPDNSQNFTEVFPQGAPLFRVTYQASVCWDPRDPAQDREDESTWQWSENLAVCALAYVLDPNGYAIPWERIEPNLDEWISAMDICDEEITLLNGGTSARYRIAGTWTHNTPPKEVIKNFENSCDGRIWQRRDGSIGISVGKFVPPTVTLTDKDILGISDLTAGQDPLFAIAGVRAQYMSPDHDYREHDAEAWPTGEAVLSLTEDRVLALDLTWCPSHNQARRMMKVQYQKQNALWRGTIVTNLYGLKAMDERWIRLQLAEVDGLDIVVEISKFTFDPSGPSCTIEFFSVDETLYDFDAATEEGLPEGGTFAFSSKGSKSGTAFDPLVDAGASIGQTVLVVVGADNATLGVAATPAGYDLIVKAGPSNNVSSGAFTRVIDGTEGSVTLLQTSGIIQWVVFDYAPFPSQQEAAIDGSSGSIALKSLPDAIGMPPAPFVTFFWVTSTGTGGTDYGSVAIYTNGSAVQVAPEYTEFLDNGTLQQALMFDFWSSSETPQDRKAAALDTGAQMLGRFIFQPGS